MSISELRRYTMHAYDTAIKNFSAVEEFHEKFGLKDFGSYTNIPAEVMDFRNKFLIEESNETFKALAEKNKHEVLDGLVDLAYVALGTLYLSGKQGRRVINERAPVFAQPGSSGFGLLSLPKSLASIENGVDAYGIHYYAHIARGCVDFAGDMGFDFASAFSIVRSANMKKVRAANAGQSKRGSSFDVVKPQGWVPPNLDACLG